MPQDPKNRRSGSAKDLVNVSATAIAAAVGTALSAGASPGMAALVSVGAGTTPSILTMVAGWTQERRQRRLESYLDSYYRAVPGVDPEAVEAELHASAEDPLVREVVIEGLRVVDDVMADAVVPTLARLTREYVSNAVPADWFFRGVRRTLSDVSADEFDCLRSMVHRVVALDPPATPDGLRLEQHHARPQKPAELTCNWISPGEDASKATWAGRQSLGAAPHARRLFYLFKTNGLGEDAATGGFSSRGGADVIYVQREVMDRLWRLLK